MPRIRQFKPEHRQHRKVGPLTDREYRLWTSMILEADDAGRLVCSAPQLRAVTWPYHDVRLAQVEAAIQRLAALGLIRIYRVEDIRYADFPSWRDHQRKDHWYPSILPEYNDSLNAHGVVREHSSGNGLGKVGMEQVGMEGTHGMQPPSAHADNGGAKSGINGQTPPVPDWVTRALDRAPILGKTLRLRNDAPWWLAQIRAHPGLDLATCVARAESWLATNALKARRKKDLVRFLHNWFANETEG